MNKARLCPPSKRGEILCHEVLDLTRVAHPKTADIVCLKDQYVVVPTNGVNPVKTASSLSEAMDFIERYLGAGE